VDCLLVHVPKFNHAFGPYRQAMFINFMAVGLLSVADSVRRAGFDVGVLHLGLELGLDPSFELAQYLRAQRPKIVGISLHWHHQAPGSLDVAALVREILPEAFVVVGGQTASDFPEEILSSRQAVEAVIVGEGERPMRELVEAVVQGRSLATIPNLWWRSGSSIVRNTTRWSATGEELSGFDFTNFSLLRNARHYPRLFPYMFPPRRRHLNRLLFEKQQTTSFHVPLGRGCMNHCAWCGGGAEATVKLLGRTEPSAIHPEAVVATIERARSLGYSAVGTNFSGPGMESVLRESLALCRQRRLRPTWHLHAWEFLSAELAEDFAATVAPDSLVDLSPDFATPQQRGLYKTFQFTNEQLLEQVNLLGRKGLLVALYFLYGLPGQEKHASAQEKLLAALHARSNVRRVQFLPCELEPCSPLILEPERFGIVPHVRSLADFEAAHRRGFKMGFSHLDRSEEEVFNGQCRSVCLMGRNGQRKCRLIRAATAHPVLDRGLYLVGKAIWRLGRDPGVSHFFSPGSR
jgi:clorobiocin biosynthesis protein CloN6